jgi:aryl-alcohol dehydrogenase-like predicted oxidoreductase
VGATDAVAFAVSRADVKDRRRLGSTGLEVHPLCLGGNVFGWTADREATFALLDAYVDAGGNFVDTADSYSTWVPGNRGGESERLIGEWLASRRPPDMIVGTKVGGGTHDVPRGLTRRQVVAGCEASLRRLGVETIDLYYAHHDFTEPDLEETLTAFDELVQAGKVRFVGASNYASERLAEALGVSARQGLTPYTVLQTRVNLVYRDSLDDELLVLCEAKDIGIAGYAGLAGGFLTGKYRPGGDLPQVARANRIASTHLGDEQALRILATAEEVAWSRGATVAQIALAWVLHQPAIASVIASARTPAQLHELMGATGLALTSADHMRLATPTTARA